MAPRAACGSRFAGSPVVTLGAASATTPFPTPTVRQRRFGDLKPAAHVFNGLFFIITGLHMLHVLAGTFALLWTRVNRKLLQYYWWLVDLVWIGILIAFYV